MKPKVGIFNQPVRPTKKSANPGAPWTFKPSMADQRAGPSPAAGTYYGTGVKNPVGKMRGDSVGYRPVSKKQMGTPPKSLA